MNHERWQRFPALLIVCFSIASVSNVSSQIPQDSAFPVELDIRIGFSGLYHPGSWVPVTVLATTDRLAFEDDFLLDVEGGGERKDIYHLSLQLAPNATKQYSFLAHLPHHTSEYTVRLPSSEREIPVTAKPVPSDEFILLAVVDRSDRFLLPSSLLAEQRETGGVHVAVAQPDRFPRSFLGLKGIDLLVIRSSVPFTLDEEQVQAVFDWAVAGGTLLICPDGFGRIAGELAEILPVEVQGTHTAVPRDPFGPGYPESQLPSSEILLPSFTLHPDAYVLLGSRESPSLISRHVGFGNLLFFPFDLSAEWIQNHPGYENFWTRIVEQLNPREPETEHSWAPSPVGYYPFGVFGGKTAINEFLANIRGRPKPSITFLVAFLAVYLPIMGIVLVYFVYRRQQRHRSVIVIPAVSVVFAVFGLLGGYSLGSHRIHLKQLEIVRKVPDFPTAVSECSFSLSAPSSKTYSLTGDPQPLRFVNLPFHGLWEQPPPATFYRSLRGDGQALSFHMYAWTLKSFATEQVLPFEGEIAADLRIKDATLSGRIENRLPFDLSGLLLVHGDEVFPLGDLPALENQTLAGIERPLVEPLAMPTPEAPGWFSVPSYMYGGSMLTSSETHPLELADVARWEHTVYDAVGSTEIAEVYSKVLAAEWVGLSSWRPVSFLLACASDSFVTPGVSDHRVTREKHTVLLYPLETVASDHLMLGSSWFVLDQSLNEDFQPWTEALAGEVGVPIPRPREAKQIEFRLPQGSDTGDVKLRRFDTNEWVLMPASSPERNGWRPLAQPENYIDPTRGEIRFLLQDVTLETLADLKVRILYDQD
jgi:hypothetical protein